MGDWCSGLHDMAAVFLAGSHMVEAKGRGPKRGESRAASHLPLRDSANQPSMT